MNCIFLCDLSFHITLTRLIKLFFIKRANCPFLQMFRNYLNLNHLQYKEYEEAYNNAVESISSL
jgi:hypothetical protein